MVRHAVYVYVPHAMPAFVVSKVRLVCPPTSKLTPSSPCYNVPSIVTTAPGVLVKCGPSREAQGG